jgi:hypothetical protein
MTEERVAQDRLRSLPPIRRTRLWRLYAETQAAGKPGRFLDLWMEDGRSLLGAKGTGIGTAAKAAVDTGRTRPFPSVREARLTKAVLAAYPGYAAARFYASEERAMAAFRALPRFGSPTAPGGFALRVLAPFAEFLRERPLLGAGTAASGIAAPRLPCPALLAPSVLLFEDAAEAEAAEGELMPPLLLECAHRALLEMERYRLTYNESLWKRVDRRLGRSFERGGPYLYPRCSEADYGAFFAAALSAGVLLSPRYEVPSIVPGDFDDGELAALASALGRAKA